MASPRKRMGASPHLHTRRHAHTKRSPEHSSLELLVMLVFDRASYRSNCRACHSSFHDACLECGHLETRSNPVMRSFNSSAVMVPAYVLLPTRFIVSIFRSRLEQIGSAVVACCTNKCTSDFNHISPPSVRTNNHVVTCCRIWTRSCRQR